MIAYTQDVVVERAAVGRRDPLWRQSLRATAGMVLVAAVLLKLQAPAAGESLVLFAPQVRQAGLAVEAVVGLWLVSGFAVRGGWLVGLVLFSILAGVSGYLAAVGQSDCGCFGRVSVSPWGSLALNVACVAALIVGRPPTDRNVYWRTAAIYCGLVAGGAILLAGAGSRVGEAWLLGLRGEALAVVPTTSDAGQAAAGEVRVVPVEIVNRSGGDVRILGGSVSCTCMATDGLPVTIPPLGHAEVRVKIRFDGSAGRFGYFFEFYTDSSDQPKLTGRLAGTVVGPP